MHPRLSVYGNRAYFDASETCRNRREQYLRRWYLIFDDGSMCMVRASRGVRVVEVERVPVCVVERDAKVLKVEKYWRCPLMRQALVFRVYLRSEVLELGHDMPASEILSALDLVASAYSWELARRILLLIMDWRAQEFAQPCS